MNIYWKDPKQRPADRSKGEAYDLENEKRTDPEIFSFQQSSPCRERRRGRGDRPRRRRRRCLLTLKNSHRSSNQLTGILPGNFDGSRSESGRI